MSKSKERFEGDMMKKKGKRNDAGRAGLQASKRTRSIEIKEAEEKTPQKKGGESKSRACETWSAGSDCTEGGRKRTPTDRQDIGKKRPQGDDGRRWELPIKRKGSSFLSIDTAWTEIGLIERGDEGIGGRGKAWPLEDSQISGDTPQEGRAIGTRCTPLGELPPPN